MGRRSLFLVSFLFFFSFRDLGFGNFADDVFERVGRCCTSPTVHITGYGHLQGEPLTVVPEPPSRFIDANRQR